MSNYITDDLKQQVKSIIKGLPKQKSWDDDEYFPTYELMVYTTYEEGKYDLILMDLQMPIMDGYEATINIRLKDVSVPIIALTASASFGYIEKAALLGINEYILKPINPKELNLKLRKHFKNILDYIKD